ncbi:MAG: hypothetical protein ACP5E3_06715 [Bacteroidales bacterium]
MKVLQKTFVLGIFLASCMCFQINAQNLPEVIAFRELALNKSTNEIIFLNYYSQWCELITEHSKGASGWVMKGDRGKRNGEYVFAWTFNYKSTRDYYFPSSQMANYPQWNAVLNRFDFHAPEQPLVDSINSYTDFIVIGFPKMIAPQLGEIIAVRFFHIEEEKQVEFENFIEDIFHPAYQEHIDGYFNYVLKGDRGDKEGQYMLLTVFDNADRRNEYYPIPLEPASESFMSQYEAVLEIDEKFRTFLPENIDFDYTDYIVVY